MQITVTKEDLKRLNACTNGYEYWVKTNKPDLVEFMQQAIIDNHPDWANWLFCKMTPKKVYLTYAIFAAEQVIDIYEKRYPDNKTPRAAIEAAKAVLENDNEETRKTAYAAAYAAYAATAAYAAAKVEMLVRILNFGINYLKTYEVE